MSSTVLFAIFGAVLGAIGYLIANLRLKWVVLALILWVIFSGWNDA